MKRAALVLMAALATPAAALAQAPPAPPAPPEMPKHAHTGASAEQRHGRPAGPATTVDQKRPAAPDASVSIENMAGSIKVTGWDRSEVQVRGTVADGASLEFDGTEKRIRVEVNSEHGNPMHKTSDLEVFVPSACSVDVEGFSAAITLNGLSGNVKAETVNGGITHAGPSKDVQLQSVNGGVQSSRASGRTHLESVNGGVTVRDSTGEIDASTVNGVLTVAGGSFSRAQLETVSGGIRFEAGLAAKGTLGVESVSGTIDLAFAKDFGADFVVTTFSGAITNELGPAAQKKDSWSPEKELSFTTGQGGARVTVETLSGAVKIRKKP